MKTSPMLLALALTLPACLNPIEGEGGGAATFGDTDPGDDGDAGNPDAGDDGADDGADAGADGGSGDGGGDDGGADDGGLQVGGGDGGADDGGADDGGADDGGADDGGADDGGADGGSDGGADDGGSDDGAADGGGSDDGGADDGANACEPVEVTLVAGQNLDAGFVTISTSDGGLVIDVEAVAPWSLSLVHIYAGADVPPINDGSMAPGLFPYAYDVEGDLFFSTTIPFAELGDCGDVLNVAVHAEVDQAGGANETAWADGPLTVGAAWGTYLQTTLCCE